MIHKILERSVYGKRMPVIHVASNSYRDTVAVNFPELEVFILRGGFVAEVRGPDYGFFAPATEVLRLAQEELESAPTTTIRDYGIVKRLDIPVYDPGASFGPEMKPTLKLAALLGQDPKRFYNPTQATLLQVLREVGVDKLVIDVKNNRYEIA
jgi:hypothetical protein